MISRDACGVVVVTVLAPMAVEDRPVLCRAVQEELRNPTRHLVLDLGSDLPSPPAVGAVLRLDVLCGARGMTWAVVTRDPDPVRRALEDRTAAGARVTVTTQLTTALTAARSGEAGVSPHGTHSAPWHPCERVPRGAPETDTPVHLGQTPSTALHR